ncbi:MAG: DsbE family thiol:disulfide interchange protein [Nitrococcus mobilis]|nr:DsbE family thiol:disulfide interchange protein [Nitrococcus mobilis]
MKRYLLLLPLILFGAVAVMLGVGLTLNTSQVNSPLVGKPAPDFQAPSLQTPERSVQLSDLSGQVALVNIWASWCTTCRQEHPYLMALSEQGIPIYGIDYKDERPKALAWLEQYGNAYRAIAFDAQGRVGMDWGVYGVPETYVIDRQGVIRHKHIGAITAHSLREQLQPLIAELRREGESR